MTFSLLYLHYTEWKETLGIQGYVDWINKWMNKMHTLITHNSVIQGSVINNVGK